MAEHIWSVLCDMSIVDHMTSKISLIGSVEKIRIHADEQTLAAEMAEAEESGEPYSVRVKFDLVSYWVRSDHEVSEEERTQILIECPDASTIIAPQVATVDLMDNESYRVRAHFTGMPFRGLGTYWFEVLRAEDVREGRRNALARIPVNVILAPLEEVV